MKFPKKIRILGTDVPIRTEKLEQEEDGKFLFGQYLADVDAIFVNSLPPDHVQRTTLLHEIIEAINFKCELDLEHTQIMTIEAVLFQILSDNKQLIDIFKEK